MNDFDMPILIHRGCDLPLHWEAVEYHDGLGLTWVCLVHGPVPVCSAAISTGHATAPNVTIPLVVHCEPREIGS
jgi:hypothetical protein